MTDAAVRAQPAIRRAGPWPVAGYVLCSAALVVLGGSGVTALGLLGEPGAAAAGIWLSAAIAVVGGLVALIRSPASAGFLRLAGAGLLLWGLAQALRGAPTPEGWATAAEVAAVLAVPLLAAAMFALPRPLAGSLPWLRLALDAALMALTMVLVLWVLAFRLRLGDASAAALLIALLVDVLLLALTLLVWLRDLQRDLLVLAMGAGLFAAADLVARYGELGSGGLRWQAAVGWVAGVSLIVVGVLRSDGAGAPSIERADVDPDARVVVTATTLSLGLLAVGLGAWMTSDALDHVSAWLVLAAVLVFWAREVFNTRLRSQLLLRLHDEATSDPLTGLANRRVLAARVASLPRGEPWCLLTMDLDGFKAVNDLLGHATGDRLLRAVAQRLRAAVPIGALASRMGGDEFAVLVPGTLEVASEVGQRVVAAVRQAAGDVDGVHRVAVSASVGVAQVGAGPAPTSVPDGLPASADPLGALTAAGAALRAAKTAGRDRIEVFDGALASARRRRLRVEDGLRSAVRNGDLRVCFQPVVDLRRGGVIGAESLARWRDPELGEVTPSEFIPVAEQTGLVVALGERVLRETLSAAVAAGFGERGLRVSCNVSPVQLRVPGFCRFVEEMLAMHRVRPDHLVLEVTESVFVDEQGQAVLTLQQLAELGVTIAIDDFGTGYSALGYLRRLPAQVLKIDRSLTSSLVAQADARAITQAVVEMSRSVGLSVIVEGIEDAEVADLVRRMGADFAQGTWFGRPMSAAGIAAMADRRRGVGRPA